MESPNVPGSSGDQKRVESQQNLEDLELYHTVAEMFNFNGDDDDDKSFTLMWTRKKVRKGNQMWIFKEMSQKASMNNRDHILFVLCMYICLFYVFFYMNL